jgi:hypothetical protein
MAPCGAFRSLKQARDHKVGSRSCRPAQVHTRTTHQLDHYAQTDMNELIAAQDTMRARSPRRPSALDRPAPVGGDRVRLVASSPWARVSARNKTAASLGFFAIHTLDALNPELMKTNPNCCAIPVSGQYPLNGAHSPSGRPPSESSSEVFVATD